MTLDQLIENLNARRDIHGGDIPVFVNGEYGFNNIEECTGDHISVGMAYLELDDEYIECSNKIDGDATVMHIGGD